MSSQVKFNSWNKHLSRVVVDAEWRDFKRIQKQAERANNVFTRNMYRQILASENVPVLKVLGKN